MSRISDLLVTLAACLCNQIEEMGLPKTCFCGVVPGEAAAQDYAGDCTEECGMAWVRLATAFPSTAVGEPDVTVDNCNKGLSVTIEVGIMRCMPLLDEDGTPPSADELVAVTTLQMDDYLAMMRAVWCCDALDAEQTIVGAYQPLGPEGGIVGGTINLDVGL